jgi:hypothetical protein
MAAAASLAQQDRVAPVACGLGGGKNLRLRGDDLGSEAGLSAGSLTDGVKGTSVMIRRHRNPFR